jgi:hypothetical protein
MYSGCLSGWEYNSREEVESPERLRAELCEACVKELIASFGRLRMLSMENREIGAPHLKFQMGCVDE